MMESPPGDEGACKARNLEMESEPGRRIALYEFVAFVFLLFPSMMLSFFSSSRTGLRFEVVAVATLLRDLSLVGLVLFFLWRNGERVSRIGWTAENLPREVLMGLGFFPLFTFGAAGVQAFLGSAGFPAPPRSLPPFLLPSGKVQLLSALILVLVVAVSEEVVFRGYMIHRLRSVTSSQAAALFLSSVIFSFGHGYEGSVGVLMTGFMGLILGVVYLWRGSLVAPTMMHFLQDLIGLVLVPLSGLK